MDNLGQQVKGLLAESTSRLKELQEEGIKVVEKAKVEGRKVAEKVKATVDQTRASGEKVVGDVMHDRAVKDLFGRMQQLDVTQWVGKIKATDMTKQAEMLRHEFFGMLHLASADQVRDLHQQNERLAKEVASLRTMKPQITRLAEAVKELKTTAKKGA